MKACSCSDGVPVLCLVPLLGLLAAGSAFGLLILMDNAFARFKWQSVLKSAWRWPAYWASAISWCCRSCTEPIYARTEIFPRIVHYDASSCNGCDIETLACLTPLYDVERLGVHQHRQPEARRYFLVTGAVNDLSKEVVRNIYNQLADPRWSSP